MMDGTFVEKLRAAFAFPLPAIVEGKDVMLVPSGWTVAKAYTKCVVNALEVHTLSALKTYLDNPGVDLLDKSRLFLHVESPSVVNLYGPIGDDEHNLNRNHYLSATTTHDEYKFEHYVEHEQFIIGLMSRFDDTPERDALLLQVASIKDNEVVEVTDDTVSQKVNVQQGVHLVGTVRVTNPVTLAPFRTFPEVDQPESQFVIRLRRGGGGKPAVALFEADGGAWQLEAIDSIAAWLKANCPGVAIVA